MSLAHYSTVSFQEELSDGISGILLPPSPKGSSCLLSHLEDAKRNKNSSLSDLSHDMKAAYISENRSPSQAWACHMFVPLCM